MNCFNNTFGWCSLVSDMIGTPGYNPEYDEDFRVDDEGVCMCHSDNELLDCPCFENDENFLDLQQK